MNVEIDDKGWPLVVSRWQGQMSDADLNLVLVRMDGWLARRERFGLLIDSRGAKGFSPEQRTRLISHMKQRAVETEKYLVQAVVQDSLLLRTLYYGMNLIFPNPFPSKVFAEPEAARAWLAAVLAEKADARGA